MTFCPLNLGSLYIKCIYEIFWFDENEVIVSWVHKCMYPCFTVWVFILRLYDKPCKFAIYICRLDLVQGYHLEQKISHWLILTPWIKVHDWMCQSEHGCDNFSIDGICQCIPSLLWFLILHDECINHQYFTSNILIVYFNKVPKVYASCCSLI